MRYIKMSLTLLLLLAFFSNGSLLLASEHTVKEELSREFAFEPGGCLVLDNPVGEIKVIGWDEPRAEIFAVKKVRYEDDPDYARERLEKINIKIDKSGNTIRIKTRFPGGHDANDIFSLSTLLKFPRTAKDKKLVGVSYTIKLPRRTDLRVEQAVGGLAVNGIESDIRADISVGEISLIDINGEINAETGVGEVLLKRISGPADVSVGVGGVTLSLAPDAEVDIRASCGMGDIDCTFPVSVKGKFLGKSLRGKINGGGPRICLEAGVGGVRIKH